MKKKKLHVDFHVKFINLNDIPSSFDNQEIYIKFQRGRKV